MSQDKIIDHLFRHQYGKMVSILTRIFGFSNLEIIEDAVQDTFLQATQTWKTKFPKNPEAWLTQAAKNRTIDLFRKIKADNLRIQSLDSGPIAIEINNLFLDNEIGDSQLRMIFACCHPSLQSKDQIVFSLKTISGFNQREIAAALLTKEDSIKKRLQRARKTIIENNIELEIPEGKELKNRLFSVLQVIYLIFNEGFHSNGKGMIIRKDLCGEALRLCKILLNKESLRESEVYSLFALMCFHSARLETKSSNDEVIELKHQKRKEWYKPLIKFGNSAFQKAITLGENSSYFFEAAIAREHVNSNSYEDTNWEIILYFYTELYELHPSDFILLNQVIVLLQLKNNKEVCLKLKEIDPKKLEQKTHLFHAVYTEYYLAINDLKNAKISKQKTLDTIHNEKERNHFLKKFDSV